tara:strand:+ start:2595 stop:4028 length:1434 start_codon:yes stop_codon:yes gene_type:complete
MAKLSQIQGIKLSQNIALTPQLIQAIKLFELNNIELEEYINREIIDNPFLDKDDGSNEEDADKNYNENILTENTSSNESEIHISNQESPIDDQSNIFDNNYGSDNSEINNYIEETVSFKQSSKDFLIEQVNITFKNALDRQIAFLLIDNLESSGFLKISLKDFSIDIGINENKINEVLSKLKKFEPVGIFSQSLEESFLLQLEDRELLNNSIKKLINNLEILASGDLKKLIKICDIDENEIFKMLKIIRSCNPSPLSSFDKNDYDDIKEPDVVIKKIKSKWIVELNENTLPKVLVNTGYYEELASKNLTKEDKDYLATRYASGKWLLKALEQRSATILRVSREIIRQQNAFLENGLAYIKPMILKDIAKELDLHESTISRITNSKEIDTPRGIYSLKFFFSKAIVTAGNDDISSQSVKTKIRNFIDNETVKTLSDKKLKYLLDDSGINIARRTITKYREEMNIPSSFERKKIKKLKI